jgi:translocation and assembly module TamB
VGLRADLRATLRHPEAGELRLDGSVPIDLGWSGVHPDLRTAPVDLRLHAARLDLTFLRALAPHELRQSAGRITLDVRIGGPRAAPRGDGHIALTDGRIEIAAVGVPYEEVRAELVLAGDTLEVRALHARAGGGSLDGTGRIGLAGDRTLDLSVRLDDFLALRRDVVEAQASGTLAVRGTLASPDVRGTLEVQRGIVRPAALPASGPPLDRDATITVVGRPEPAVPPPSPAARLAEALRLDVEIGVPRNVWIRRADASIELGGELRAQKAAGEPLRLIGTIRLLRGWYAFQGRRFTIEEGTIRFTGATPPEPRFDITATSRSGEYRIIVRVEGSSKKPTLKLTSDPPLEQADILSVILFGKPATELGRRESVGLQRQAIQLASGYVAPELRTSVMNTLGLDALDVELQEGSESASRVTLGRYVASDVFVSLGQEFGARTAEVLGVEYGLTRRISVKGSTSTRGDSAVDLFWHRRY